MSVDALLNQGFKAYNDGDFSAAEAFARQALSLQNTHGDALYLLALVAMKADAIEKASEILYAATKLYPDMAQYQLLLASVLEKMNCFDEALEIYQKHQDNPDALIQMGYIYLKKNQIGFAEEAFEKALNLSPDYADALLGMALSYQKMNKPYHPLLMKIIQKQDHLETYYQLSLYAYDQKKYQQALDYVEKALQIAPSAPLLNQKGLCFEALKDFPNAVTCYNKAIEMDPYDALSYLNKGNALMHQQLLNQAEQSYRQAIHHNPRLADAFYRLGLVLFQKNNYVDALENLRSALLLNPKHLDALYALAIAVEQNNEYAEAIGLYFNILSLKQDYTGIAKRLQHCILALSKTDNKQALDFASGWVKNFPHLKIAQQTLNQLKTK